MVTRAPKGADLSYITPDLRPLAVPIDDLVADPNNARMHDEKNLAAIRASFAAFTQRKPIVVQTSTRRVEAGNGSLEVMRALGHKYVAAVFCDDTNEMATAYGIADNRAGELAEWNDATLTQLLADLAGVDDDLLRATGFDEAELEDMLAKLNGGDGGNEGNTDPDKVPDDVPSRCQPGDAWKLGEHRLMCGDCTDDATLTTLLEGAKAQLVFTDPPYGVAYRSNMSKRFDVMANDDVILEVAPTIFAAMDDDAAAIVWTSQQVYPQWRKQFSAFYKSTVIWSKGGHGMGDLAGDFAPNYEMALYCVRGRPKFRADRPGAVWDIAKDRGEDYKHPTQKPVALAEHAIKMLSDRAAVVLDMFLGSGSTLIACEKTGRRCFGVEIEPRFCDVILQRWQDFTGNLPELIYRKDEEA